MDQNQDHNYDQIQYRNYDQIQYRNYDHNQDQNHNYSNHNDDDSDGSFSDFSEDDPRFNPYTNARAILMRDPNTGQPYSWPPYHFYPYGSAHYYRQPYPRAMAQVVGHKRRGISSGDTSAPSTSAQCQVPALPAGNTPATLTDELAALFECPVCFEIVLPPIMQCQVGHLVCANCRPKLSCCPTCRGTLGNIRNLAMEKVANNLMFPCKHKATGCRMSLGLNEKAEHEEICEFRPYSCPCPGASCSWQGQLDKVMIHLQHSHKNITTLNGEDIVFLATEINLAGAVDWVMMQSCFGHHFMLVLEKQEKNDGHTQFFAIVQLIGSRKQAEHFAYRLELNGNRRRLIWEAMPRSSHEGVASAIMASDCLAFDNSIAQHFADNGNLGINVTISLVC